jgi:hypothetical protein
MSASSSSCRAAGQAPLAARLLRNHARDIAVSI